MTDVRLDNQCAFNMACYHNNIKVIDYFAANIDDLTDICVESCRWLSGTAAANYLLTKYPDKISIPKFRKAEYDIDYHIKILSRAPRLYTKEHIDELMERSKTEEYYTWGANGTTIRAAYAGRMLHMGKMSY